MGLCPFDPPWSPGLAIVLVSEVLAEHPQDRTIIVYHICKMDTTVQAMFLII